MWLMGYSKSLQSPVCDFASRQQRTRCRCARHSRLGTRTQHTQGALLSVPCILVLRHAAENRSHTRIVRVGAPLPLLGVSQLTVTPCTFADAGRQTGCAGFVLVPGGAHTRRRTHLQQMHAGGRALSPQHAHFPMHPARVGANLAYRAAVPPSCI